MFDRITIELDKMAGQPCLRGLRIPVATVVAMVADGPAGEEGLNMQARNWSGVDVTNRHVRDQRRLVESSRTRPRASPYQQDPLRRALD